MPIQNSLAKPKMLCQDNARKNKGENSERTFIQIFKKEQMVFNNNSYIHFT